MSSREPLPELTTVLPRLALAPPTQTQSWGREGRGKEG